MRVWQNHVASIPLVAIPPHAELILRLLFKNEKFAKDLISF